MNVTKNIGLLVLAIYLIVVGASGIFHFNLGQAAIVVPVLACISGVLILLGK